MKKELIKTDNYLLVVDDSEIKVGDWVIETRNGLNELHFTNSRYVIDKHIQKKVIAHLPLNNSPILEGVPLLPPLEQEDDEKILFANEIENMLEYDRGRWYGRIEGYNKAIEKYKFTEEDVKNALSESFKASQEGYQITTDEIIQSLSQPKTPTHFECKTFDTGNDELDGTHILEIRTTTNSQGQQVACGKYVY
jgi:hypothetical protein